METVLNMLQDPNVQWVLLGTILLGIASGVIGSFALLRKQSLLGDAMAHAALPGICIAFLLYGAKSMSWFLIGASISGLIGTYCIQAIIKHSRIKEDTAIGLVLSVFFGFGIVLLTYIQQNGSGNQAGLDSFIFGQAAAIVGLDVQIISVIAFVLIFITFILFKELKLITFDPQFAQGIGLPVKWLNGLLMTMIVGAVVIGLQAVGVILMAAMLITPAITARYWTERLDYMVVLAGIVGGVSGVVGTLLSTLSRGMPTGPLIILAATLLFLFSLLFGTKKGLLPKMVKQWKVKRLITRENVLSSLYELSETTLKESEGKEMGSYSFQQVVELRPVSSLMLLAVIKELKKEGLLAEEQANKQLMLTEKGLELAHEIVLKNRLLDMYLMFESKFPVSNWREGSMDLLNGPKEIIDELRALLKDFGREPNGLFLYKKKRKLGNKGFHSAVEGSEG
ncbi:iron chelate uptake ABC transporter family permease subunit [Sutcliffiella horikoshii]|uniref:Manganese transport system membrane protein MntC n=1 Tax=Sutcliffiella horikoshii TaxID=79883 RepID=A0AA94WJS9_9BACI|nr:metal ABC transporter permease [Sutcliffiella horikoshii]TYS55712.1 iron chelate uptake ABC transporter family permease subunit [Sutcliffiella horikoshii]